MSQLPEGKWDFYFANVNGKPSSIFLDLTAHRLREGREQLLCVFVPLKDPHPDHQMTTQQESEVLWQLEDLLLKEAVAIDARFVGRITGDGRREFYFYCKKSIAWGMEETRSRFADYTFDIQWHHDPEWRQYGDVLYPRPEQMESIQNRGVLQQLTKAGDSLKKPREITHWAYFSEAVNRDAFVDQVVAAGFRIVKTDRIDLPTAKERPFVAVVAKIDHVHPTAIDKVTVELLHLSKRY